MRSSEASKLIDSRNTDMSFGRLLTYWYPGVPSVNQDKARVFVARKTCIQGARRKISICILAIQSSLFTPIKQFSFQFIRVFFHYPIFSRGMRSGLTIHSKFFRLHFQPFGSTSTTLSRAERGTSHKT